MLLGLEVGNCKCRFNRKSVLAPIHTWLFQGNCQNIAGKGYRCEWGLTVKTDLIAVHLSCIAKKMYGNGGMFTGALERNEKITFHFSLLSFCVLHSHCFAQRAEENGPVLGGMCINNNWQILHNKPLNLACQKYSKYSKSHTESLITPKDDHDHNYLAERD